MRLVFATYNPGKMDEVRTLGQKYGVDVVSLTDVGVQVRFDETGSTFEENARLKLSQAQAALVNERDWVAADDSGIMIDALGGEPGVKTRRWIGREMTDAEIEATILERLQGVPPARRTSHLKTVVAMGKAGQKPLIFEGDLSGMMLIAPDKDTASIEGFPDARLFFISEIAKTYGQYVSNPGAVPDFQSHRARAFAKAFRYLNDLQSVTGQFE
jgi:XTP/dITP diphosphohydrolase